MHLSYEHPRVGDRGAVPAGVGAGEVPVSPSGISHYAQGRLLCQPNLLIFLC